MNDITRPPRILIVDDDQAVQVSLALLLKQSGYDARCCDDARRRSRCWPPSRSTWSCRT